MNRNELLKAARRGMLFSTQMVQQLPPRGNKCRTMRVVKGKRDKDSIEGAAGEGGLTFASRHVYRRTGFQGLCGG